MLWVEGKSEGRKSEDEGLEVLLVEELGRGGELGGKCNRRRLVNEAS